MSWVVEVPSEPSDTLPSGVFDAATLAYVQANFRHFGLLVKRDDPRVKCNSLEGMESPDAARDVFLAYENLTVGSNGGHRLFSMRDEEAVEQIQIAMHAINRATLACSTDDPSLTPALHAPSCWHAAIMLTLLQLEFRHEGRQLAFRGQAAVEWELTTSWQRADPADRKSLLRKRLRFETFSMQIGQELGFSMPKPVLRAISQHHGFRSNLLDLTTDPLIAIWFAMDFENNHTHKRRCVWYRDVASLAHRGSRFVLPPPFLCRLHAQRGFFLDRSRGRGADLRGSFHLLTFDWLDETDEEFQLLWLGSSYPAYPHVQWIERLTNQVQELDHKLHRTRYRKALLGEIREIAHNELADSNQSGEYGASTSHEVPLHDEPWASDTHSGLLYDAIYRLAAVIEHIEGTRLHMPVLQTLIKHNPDLSRSLVEAIRTPPESMAIARADYQLADLIVKLLDDDSSTQTRREGEIDD